VIFTRSAGSNVGAAGAGAGTGASGGAPAEEEEARGGGGGKGAIVGWVVLGAAGKDGAANAVAGARPTGAG
jgi:hypothetical protein